MRSRPKNCWRCGRLIVFREVVPGRFRPYDLSDEDTEHRCYRPAKPEASGPTRPSYDLGELDRVRRAHHIVAAEPATVVARGGGDSVIAALFKEVQQREHRCRTCRGSVEPVVGRRGPLLRCRQAACHWTELVSDGTNDIILRKIGASCPRCAVALSSCREKDRAYVRCSRYPNCRHEESWPALQSRLGSRNADPTPRVATINRPTSKVPDKPVTSEAQLSELVRQAERHAARDEWNEDAAIVNAHILKVYPNDVAALNRLAKCMLRKGNIDIAENMYRRSIDLCPMDKTASSQLEALRRRREYQQIADKITDFALAFRRGVETRRMGNCEFAIVLLEHALTLNPRHPRTSIALAATYSSMGRHRDSEALYREVLACKPNRVACVGLAAGLRRQGRVWEARSLIEAVLREYPDDGYATKTLQAIEATEHLQGKTRR